MFYPKEMLFLLSVVFIALAACQPAIPAATATPEATTTITVPTPRIGSTMTGADGATILYVPAGEFTMGTDAIHSGKFESGNPQHITSVDAFWIDQTEVTNEMYAKCVQTSRCTPPFNTSHFSDRKYATHPVCNVNWYQAGAYCSWAGRRLPTEAEWEKAARGTDARFYPWGSELDCEHANHNKNCVKDTTPVGSYEIGKSPYGAYDMAGNVWEWTASVYKPYPYNAADGREDPNSSDLRTIRGGSWENYGIYNIYLVRTYIRGWADPSFWVHFIGFRCAVSP